jgi:ribonuclease BN (tRNA processing enzyme)
LNLKQSATGNRQPAIGNEMRVKLLPSTIDKNGQAGPEQRLTCYLIDDFVAIDAGSLAFSLTDEQRESVRDVVITHPHIDHIASLPILIDDLFGDLRTPVRVHATQEIIEILERDIFNWAIYPRFSELRNGYGAVMEYVTFEEGKEFSIGHLKMMAVQMNHQVPTVGLVISDEKTTLAFTSDTYKTEAFWDLVNNTPKVDALFIEASFPNEMSELAELSRHFTPATMKEELEKLHHKNLDILIVHIKPTYRDKIIAELEELNLPTLQIMQAGKVYEW